jgi:hypothetical protein
MMEITLIFRPSSEVKRKLHLGEKTNSGSLRPLCGGGRDARSVTAWQTDIGGISDCTCAACIRKLAKIEGVK